MTKNIIKLFFAATGAGIIYWANGGIENNLLNLVQTLVLILGWQVVLWIPRFEKYVLMTGAAFMGLMVMCYLVYQVEWSGLMGSTGMGLFLIFIVFKIPTLIRKGQI
jgi:hypothetical protein